MFLSGCSYETSVFDHIAPHRVWIGRYRGKCEATHAQQCSDTNEKDAAYPATRILVICTHDMQTSSFSTTITHLVRLRDAGSPRFFASSIGEWEAALVGVHAKTDITTFPDADNRKRTIVPAVYTIQNRFYKLLPCTLN